MTDNLKYVAEYLFTYKHCYKDDSGFSFDCYENGYLKEVQIPEQVMSFLSRHHILNEVQERCHFDIKTSRDLSLVLGSIRELSVPYLEKELKALIHECSAVIENNIAVTSNAETRFPLIDKPECFDTPEEYTLYQEKHSMYLSKYMKDESIYSVFIIRNANAKCSGKMDNPGTSTQGGI